MKVYGTVSSFVLKECGVELLTNVQRALVDTFNANAREASSCILGSRREARPITKQLHLALRYVAFLSSRVLDWRLTRLRYDEGHEYGANWPTPA
jgi:hypothetical protein